MWGFVNAMFMNCLTNPLWVTEWTNIMSEARGTKGQLLLYLLNHWVGSPKRWSSTAPLPCVRVSGVSSGGPGNCMHFCGWLQQLHVQFHGDSGSHNQCTNSSFITEGVEGLVRELLFTVRGGG